MTAKFVLCVLDFHDYGVGEDGSGRSVCSRCLCVSDPRIEVALIWPW